MKSWQISALCLSLVLLVPFVFWLTYTLWSVSPKLALGLEFSLILAFVLAWFALFDRIVSHA
jgi:hypothetical protein